MIIGIPTYEGAGLLDMTGPYEMFHWAGFEIDLLAASPLTRMRASERNGGGTAAVHAQCKLGVQCLCKSAAHCTTRGSM